jgi:hypothetical protein
MKSKHDKSSNGSDRSSQERGSKFDKYDKGEERSDRFYRTRSRSESPRHGDLKKSNHGK